MDKSFSQRDLGANRKWKFCPCEQICGKHGVHDVSDTGPYIACNGEYQPLYETIRGVEFRAGLPNWDTLNPE